ncbi:putative ABC transport system permease protein [Rhodanobacter sp. ANJX3]|uniref:ABC transporter permease n=1 Tax=Rhodanobacter sp. ANJX3 TaxID=2723083 RepID=UPI00161154E0|nr:ABC transporter permease [Rhodanobacter sp. ANJX3]MBB5360330.1 putative ABC transport system permease protein [Rhodanobacter sp. ANJX3]
MFAYYLDLALRSLRRNKVFTVLMVVCVGLGIGASMTMITVVHVMSDDPLPERSGQLYYPHIDPWPAPHGRSTNPHASDNLTLPDAMNLLRAGRAPGQAAMSGAAISIHSEQPNAQPLLETGHYVTADFFSMFGVPFRAGGGWTHADDERHARVIALSSALNRMLFGDSPGIGRTVRVGDEDFRVIGVLDDWHPQPMFYADVNGRAFGRSDAFFLPLQTALDLKLDFRGSLSCHGDGGDDRTTDRCTWLQFWVKLENPKQVSAYMQFLADYWRQQQAHGRFPQSVDPKLYRLMDWLAYKNVVPGDVRLQLWLALGFLGVCMVDIVGLLLAKFLRRSNEISVRRALGARRGQVFLQFGIESAVIGVLGGVLGLAIAELGLWSVRQRPDGYAQLASMDVSMLMGTFLLAIGGSVLAGLLPAWRACRIAPAIQLKAH